MRVTLRTVVAVSLLLLVVNAGYIWAFATPSIFYMGNVLAHLALGIIVCAAGLALLARDGDLRRGIPIRLATLALAVAFGFGAYLVYKGNVRELHWALQSHIVASIVGVTLVLIYAWRRSGRELPGVRRYAVALQVAAIFQIGRAHV